MSLGRRASLALFNQVALGSRLPGDCYMPPTWWLVRLWLRLQKLSRYELPPATCDSRILELALKAGVTLREIYLLPAAKAGSRPFMIRRRRLILSDVLLRV